MRAAVALALLNTVVVVIPVAGQGSQVSNIETMLQGGTTAPVVPAMAPQANVIPSLGGSIPSLSPPSPAFAAASPAPPPAPIPSPTAVGLASSEGSALGGRSTNGGGIGGLLTGFLKNADSASNGFNSDGLGDGRDADWKHPKVHVSEESREIVRGMVEAFMHRQQLLPGEKECLENSVSQLTGDIVGTGKDVIVGVKSLMNGGMGQAGFGQKQQTAAQGNVASAGIDGAIKLVQLVTLSTTLVKNCVQGDALEMLKEAAAHLVNITRLEQRLMVSGVDIVAYLADSITAFERHRYHRFGKDIGGALRKVLLSNSTTGKRLPEGVPEEDVIRKTTEGIMSGFFVPGEVLEITDKADPNVDIQLDLHRCIAGNQPFFKQIFQGVWHAMAQFSANGQQHGLASAQPAEGTPKWTGELMVAMLQLPTALSRCDLGIENEQMLGEALKTMGSLKFQFHMPHDRVSMKRIGDRMAKGVQSWTNWHFHEYGHEIGFMLRELMLMIYPQKYTVDQSGRLRRQLESSSMSRIHGKGFSVLVVAGMTFAVLVGFMAVRTMRSMREASRQEYDIEMNDGAAE